MATTDQGNDRFDDDAPRRRGRTGGAQWSGNAGAGHWSESARQVWLAGVGAWTRAQAEGSRLFDGLVREGMEAERHGGGSADVRDSVNRGVEDVREAASGTWDRIGHFVEDSVQRSLRRMGVPRREDLDALGRRIDALSAELREARAAGLAGTPSPARRRNASQSAATKAAPARATSKGTATRKPPA